MSEPIIRNKQFLEAFERATNKTLADLGPSVRTAVLYHIAKIEGVDNDKILSDPRIFARALEKIFSTGSTIIENKIIEIMCSELGIESNEGDGSFDQKISSMYGEVFQRKNRIVLGQFATPSKPVEYVAL